MSQLQNPEVRALLEAPNHAVISTHNADGSILSTVVWIALDGDTVSVNSAVGRRWPTNLERDPQATLVVFDPQNPYSYVEIEGTASGTTEGADAEIDTLAKKYMGVDEYPYRQADEQRIRYTITPSKVRFVKQ